MAKQSKIMRILITARDGAALLDLLRRRQLDVSGGPKKLESGAYNIEAYVAEPLLKQLRAEKIKIDVLDNATATARARQKEVGKGNRFTGENRIPKGLGRKI